MMKLFLSLLIMMMTFCMYFMNHPMAMGLMILIQTLFTCILSGMMINSYWFSYILFLTFLGGLLVLFIYVSSIASNELFMPTPKIKMFIFLTFIMIIMIQFNYMNNLNWMNLNINNLEKNNLMQLLLFFNNENKININKLYNKQMMMLMIMLMIYLFITLVAVVKITNIFYGPLRSSI
uniref:NADH-ubiquinone oxidoreductase chain 6 n=1 Tax=Mustilizans hepatica TaxID=1418811 RepID=A0A344A134_9NEOP|nr:NADH dehydrogenase subunit 6 [Mustilizans hepatica]AWT58447.1 NADH dehydrogenase subunit 6 [Mustilizans hepatica]